MYANSLIDEYVFRLELVKSSRRQTARRSWSQEGLLMAEHKGTPMLLGPKDARGRTCRTSHACTKNINLPTELACDTLHSRTLRVGFRCSKLP